MSDSNATTNPYQAPDAYIRSAKHNETYQPKISALVVEFGGFVLSHTVLRVI